MVDDAGHVPLIPVSSLEEHTPADVKALNWFLLCTEGEATTGNAVPICQWYEAHWGIEENFPALKTCSNAWRLMRLLRGGGLTCIG